MTVFVNNCCRFKPTVRSTRPYSTTVRSEENKLGPGRLVRRIICCALVTRWESVVLIWTMWVWTKYFHGFGHSRLSLSPLPLPTQCDRQCFCGTEDEFEDAVKSDQCGITYPTLCTGDATTPCGGFGAISVYRRTGDFVPAPAPTPRPETTYLLTGCFADSKADRIMDNKIVEDVMSAEVRWCCF